jgi:CheY-like chemotaxis protein
MANGPVIKPRVLVIDEDLLFSTRVENTLRTLGYDVYVTSHPDEAVAIAQDNLLSLAIINFGREGLRPLETTVRLKDVCQAPPVLAFVSHKLIPETRDSARDAGCDLLVANSAVALRLPQLAARLAPLDGSVAQIVEAEEFADGMDADGMDKE